MGLFTSKIFVGVLAGSVTLGGLGLLFNGSETLQNASSFVRDSGNKIVQYEENENSLVAKIGEIKASASEKSKEQQEQIAQLQAEKAELESKVTKLETRVTDLIRQAKGLQVQLDTEKANHEATKTKLAAVESELATAKAELVKAKKDIANLNGLLQEALKKAKEGDKLVTELEGEMNKANAQVEAHGTVVDENADKTKDAAPMTQEEIDAIGTDVE